LGAVALTTAGVTAAVTAALPIALPLMAVGGLYGLVKGGSWANKGVRFKGSAAQCMSYGGVCCTGNFRGTQDFIVGSDMSANVPCRHCWGNIRRKIFLRERDLNSTSMSFD
jgi:hypothetical protein